MDYKKLVKAAGYKDATGDYIARKLAEKQIPAAKINQLHQYFPRANSLAGVDLTELGNALLKAQEKQNEPPKPPKADAPKAEKQTAVTVKSEDKN